jgi:hypothetical protein
MGKKFCPNGITAYNAVCKEVCCLGGTSHMLCWKRGYRSDEYAEYSLLGFKDMALAIHPPTFPGDILV